MSTYKEDREARQARKKATAPERKVKMDKIKKKVRCMGALGAMIKEHGGKNDCGK